MIHITAAVCGTNNVQRIVAPNAPKQAMEKKTASWTKNVNNGITFFFGVKMFNVEVNAFNNLVDIKYLHTQCFLVRMLFVCL